MGSQRLEDFLDVPTLNEGDCAYFDSTMGHALISSGPEDAKVFWDCTHIEQVDD